MSIENTILRVHGEKITMALSSLVGRDLETMEKMFFIAAVDSLEERVMRVGLVALALDVIQRDAETMRSDAEDLNAWGSDEAILVKARETRVMALAVLRTAIRETYSGAAV